GLIALLLHSTVVRYAMMVPLLLYLLSGVLRVRAYCQKFEARAEVTSNNVVSLVLPMNQRTHLWAHTMNPSSYFFLQVPSVSGIEWHPFSAIVTPTGDSIGFCMKGLTPGRFVDSLHKEVVNRSSQGQTTIPVLVGGPYGKLSVNLDQYDDVVMIAGGIGITPLLSIVNQCVANAAKQKAKFHLYWSVRDTGDLLCAERLMYPLPEALHHRFYVTNATEPGVVMGEIAGPVPYFHGVVVMDELVNNVAFVGRSVCVLACGPPGLSKLAQTQARKCGFDFHKEEFLF
ncbi:transmembrane protein, partial [Thraustotheca clavata]